MGRLRDGRKEHVWPIRRAVACSGHSTRFHTRPVSRVSAHLRRMACHEQATARRMACHEQATARRMDRYVTDEQRSSRPIFNATLRAAASWLFFRVARSTVMTQIAALYRQSGSDRLEKQPTDLRRNPRDLGDGALSGRRRSLRLAYRLYCLVTSEIFCEHRSIKVLNFSASSGLILPGISA